MPNARGDWRRSNFCRSFFGGLLLLLAQLFRLDDASRRGRLRSSPGRLALGQWDVPKTPDDLPYHGLVEQLYFEVAAKDLAQLISLIKLAILLGLPPLRDESMDALLVW